MAKEIKVRDLSPSTVEKLDNLAKKKGFKSRQDYLKNHLESLAISDQLKDKDEQYKILVNKVLKILEYNTIALNRFVEVNLLDIDEAVKEDKEKEY